MFGVRASDVLAECGMRVKQRHMRAWGYGRLIF
jgi:hypothetical protein